MFKLSARLHNRTDSSRAFAVGNLGVVRGLVALACASLFGVAATASCGGHNNTVINGGGSGGTGGSTSSGGTSSNTTGFSSPCSSDKDCRDSDGVCDVARFVCVGCLDQSDCAENTVCERGTCKAVTPCETTKECPTEQVCDRAAGHCADCVADGDCGGSSICVAATCHAGCESDKDCRDTNQVCNVANRYCVDCLSNSDCENGYCSSSVCEPHVCDPESAACLDDSLSICSADGDAWSEPFACDGSCDVSGEAPECEGFSSGGGAGGVSGEGGAGGVPNVQECGPLIDDMEDADGFTCPDDSRRGQWYTHADSGVIYPVTGTGEAPAPTVVAPARGDSTYAMHCSSDVGATNAILGIDIQRDGETYGSFDASGYSGIQFYSRSSFSDLLTIRVNTTATTETQWGGACVSACYGNTYLYVYPSTDWVLTQLPFSYFTGGSAGGFEAPFDPATITNIQFVSYYTTFDFWIDDVSFY